MAHRIGPAEALLNMIDAAKAVQATEVGKLNPNPLTYWILWSEGVLKTYLEGDQRVADKHLYANRRGGPTLL